MRYLLPVICALALMTACSSEGPEAGKTVKADVCVYGGTSAAVTAAKAAAQEGKKVIVICPDVVLGGMTTGGLGSTDKCLLVAIHID